MHTVDAVVLPSPASKTEPSLPSKDSAWVRRFYPLLLVLVGLAAYANSFQGAFVLDDEKTIVEDHLIQQPLTTSWRALLASPRGVWQATLAVNYALGGLSVEGYHVVNLLIHLLAALTLYGLVRRTLLLPSPGKRWAPVAAELALAVALLWMAHPLQTESVTYLTQRAESLMGLFYLLTLYTFLRGATASRRWGWFALAVLCCALGMRTKEVMVTAPLLVLLYDRIFLAPSWRELGRRRGFVHLGLAATLLLLAGAVRGAFAPAPTAPAAQEAKAGDALPAPAPKAAEEARTRAVPHELPGAAGFNLRRITPLDYLLNQPVALAHYLRLAFFPDALCLDYGWPPAQTLAEVVPAGLLILTLLLATIVCLWRWPALGFLGAWFFLILAPTSSILPIADLAAEHRMYLSLAAVIALVVLGGYALLDRGTQSGEVRRRLLMTAGGLVLVLAVACAALTFRRNEDYRSPLSMWKDVVAKSPNNPRAQYNLGLILLKAGKLKEALVCEATALRLDPTWPGANTAVGLILMAQNRPRQAIEHFRAELEVHPDATAALGDLGIALLQQGELQEATAVLTRAVQLEPSSAKLQLSLGTALVQQGKPRAALPHLEEADELEPNQAGTRHQMGKALLLLGEKEKALACFRKSVALAPTWVPYRLDLADALADAGQTKAATEQYDHAFELEPGLVQAFLRKAWQLATDPNPGHRDGKRALRLAEQANRVSGKQNPVFLDTLAAAQAETGHFTEAAATARRALELARARKAADQVKAIEARLRLYEQHRAYRTVAAKQS